MNVGYTLNTTELKQELKQFNGELHQAGKNICNRMGLAGEHIAAEKSPVFSGFNRNQIRWTGAIETPNGWTGELVAYSTYSIFIENGFQGHFVPFRVAPSLYREALTKWGWRIPSPTQIRHPKPGEQYLIPRGRSNPVTGVKVSGKAQPFMRPALNEVVDTLQGEIISDELHSAILRSAVK